MEGRWTIHACSTCGTAYHSAWLVCECAPEGTEVEPIPVVPCDDTAIERATRVVIDNYSYDDDDPDWARELAELVLRAAGETT